MADSANKVVMVTGANSGIGWEASVKLARGGGTLVMVGRNQGKVAAAVEEVKRRAASSNGSGAKVTSMLCDFSSLASINALADAFRKEYGRLDILVNNAGSVYPARELSVDGHEQTFAVNHLGYYALTLLLLDLVKASAPARIVNVSSVGHYKGTIDFDDLKMDKGYDIMGAYQRSKLGNVLFTRELAKRLSGTGVTVNCLHPGAVRTNIWSHAPWFAKPLLAVAKLFMISAEQGGDNIVYLATSPEVEGKTGGYYDQKRLVEPSVLAKDDALAKRLWDVSAGLCTSAGVKSSFF